MVECLKSDDGRLEENEEHEFSEDSDCESEGELTDSSAPGNMRVDYEQKRGKKLLPVLKIGSLIA